MDALVLRNASVAIAGRTLVRSLDLTLAPGHSVAIRGRSGSGKTTLLRAIAGLSDLADGEVTLGGRQPEQWGWPTWRRRVVFVANEFPLGRGTVLEAFEHAFSFASGPRTVSRSEMEAALGEVGLNAAHLSQEIASLSQGERQRARLVRAILVNPSFLLLDEPTNALDADTRTLVIDRLKAFVARGGGVLLVTHETAIGADFTDDTLHMDTLA